MLVRRSDVGIRPSAMILSIFAIQYRKCQSFYTIPLFARNHHYSISCQAARKLKSL